MTSSEDQKLKKLQLDDYKGGGGGLMSPVWSDDVTHDIHKKLTNRQLGPVSVKKPAIGGL